MTYLSASDLRSTVDLSGALDEALDGMVAEFESLAERYRGVAYTPRETTETVPVGPCRQVVLSWPLVRSVTAVTWRQNDTTTALDADGLAALVVDGSEIGPIPGYADTATVTYTHGYDSPPAGVLRACRLYVRHEWLAEQAPNTGNTYMSYNADVGVTERVSTADWSAGRPTGWLDVDRLLNALPDHRVPAFA